MDPAVLALVATLCGGIGLKITEHYLGKNKVKVDDAARIRDELRIEINNQREEISKLETGLDKWREDYYELYSKFIAQQTELTIALQKLKNIEDNPPPQ